MGYRSDIGLCLSARGMEELNKALAALDAGTDCTQEEKTWIHELFTCPAPKNSADGAGAWAWDGLKWYTDYRDVQWVEDFLNGLNEEDYYFLRIGDDIDDTEERGWLWDNPFGMRLVRSIQFD